MLFLPNKYSFSCPHSVLHILLPRSHSLFPVVKQISDLGVRSWNQLFDNVNSASNVMTFRHRFTRVILFNASSNSVDLNLQLDLIVPNIFSRIHRAPAIIVMQRTNQY